MRVVLASFFFIAVTAVEVYLPKSPNSAARTGRSEQLQQWSWADAGHGPSVPSTPRALVSSPDGKVATAQNWSGSLVDTVCFENALRQAPSTDQWFFPQPLSPYYLQDLASTQRMGKGGAVAALTAQGENLGFASRGVSRGQDAATKANQVRRAKLLGRQLAACAPNGNTTHFGLVLSGRFLLKFDFASDFKAMKRVMAAGIPAGRTVFANVMGTFNENVLSVASIELKGESRPSPARIAADSGH